MKLGHSILFSIALQFISKTVRASTDRNDEIGDILGRYNAEGNFDGVMLVFNMAR
jgi:hypothetical protein